MTSGKPKNKEKNKNIIYIIIVIILVALSVYMVLNKHSSEADGLAIDPANQEKVFDSKLVQKGDSESRSLQDLLNNLIKLGDWPVEVNKRSLGRSNPFLPTF